jgi:glucosamine--fructose-6-phosphate aminotransferase (isomerizing)
VRLGRKSGCKVLSICNVQGSSLVRDSDAVFYTQAGPEIGVASTKAYTAQLMAFALLAIHLGRIRGEITAAAAKTLIADLRRIPGAIQDLLGRKETFLPIAAKHREAPSALYLGRKFNYPTALEGALKNKEISYQHAEGYAAGEMKHGPIALINATMPVVCICTKTADEVYEKMISNMREVEARKGRIIAVATDGDTNVAQFAEDVIHVPPTRDEFSPLVNVVAMQLLAYYAAQARGTDIDKPRNLAKSVTVE